MTVAFRLCRHQYKHRLTLSGQKRDSVDKKTYLEAPLTKFCDNICFNGCVEIVTKYALWRRKVPPRAVLGNGMSQCRLTLQLRSFPQTENLLVDNIKKSFLRNLFFF